MKKETIEKILNKYINDYDNIINDPKESKTRKFIAENYRNLVETILGDLINAEDD